MQGAREERKRRKRREGLRWGGTETGKERRARRSCPTEGRGMER